MRAIKLRWGNLVMAYIQPLLLILAGILAASSLIVAKKPDAAKLIAKLTPYQATMGIILLIWGIYNAFIYVGIKMMIELVKAWPLFGITIWAMLFSSILLGIMFGMPMVAKMSASGAAKGEELAKKLAPFQLLIGIIAIASGALGLLYALGILKLSGM
jgi:hypothetical protein